MHDVSLHALFKIAHDVSLYVLFKIAHDVSLYVLFKIQQRKKQGGWEGCSLPMFMERATPPSYCTSTRFCDAALAVKFSSCSRLVCSISTSPF